MTSEKNKKTDSVRENIERYTIKFLFFFPACFYKDNTSSSGPRIVIFKKTETKHVMLF